MGCVQRGTWLIVAAHLAIGWAATVFSGRLASLMDRPDWLVDTRRAPIWHVPPNGRLPQGRSVVLLCKSSNARASRCWTHPCVNRAYPRSGVDMMRSHFSRWLRRAMRRVLKGQGLVEYALLVVLISIVSVAILSALGSNISVLYSASNVMVGLP